MGFSRAKTIAAAAVIAAFAVIIPVQMRIDSLRTTLEDEYAMPNQLPEAAAVSAALGGFRGIAVDILWMQADSMLANKQFYQLATYYNIISVLQPNFPSVWEFNSWNLAYNISAEWGRPEEKWRWIKEGIDFGNKGLKINPDSEELWLHVGLLHFLKVGKDPYFSQRFQEAEGQEPYLAASEYFRKSQELSQARGDADIRSARLYAQSLYRHAEALLSLGNVPEAVRYYSAAEEEARRYMAVFPSDVALQKVYGEITSTKDRFIK